MSRVYFEDRHLSAEVRGSDRTRMDRKIKNYCEPMLDDLMDIHVDRLEELVPAGHYLRRHGLKQHGGQGFTDAFMVSYNDTVPLLSYGGVRIEPFILRLNTAVRTGHDKMILSARVYGQCEIHGWVDGKDRNWFADIIEKHIERYLRADAGWPSVVAMLRASDASPVVMSYSVTDSFPNPQMSGLLETTDDQGAAWEELGKMSEKAQWDSSMDGLRRAPGNLQIQPGAWRDYQFSHGLALQDLLADDWRDRLAKALHIYDGWSDPRA